jgi:hypothetical protein
MGTVVGDQARTVFYKEPRKDGRAGREVGKNQYAATA